MRQIKITASVTLRDPILDKYLRDIDKIELISPEEEAALAEKCKRGDHAAIDKLTKANLRFVVSVSKKYQGRGLSLSDLINEGNIGLMEAATRFDASRGFKFISFAIWYIRRCILIALAEHARIIKLPKPKVLLGGRIYKAACELEQELQRVPSDEELADFLSLDPEDISNNQKEFAGHVSLDNPVSEDEESGTLLDIIKNPDADNTETELYHTASLRTEIDRLFQDLTERQKEVLRGFFGIGMDFPLTLDDMAKKMFLTSERIRQIKDMALTKLRTTHSKNLLRSYLAA